MEDYSVKFDELRKNRVAVSQHKYGSAKKNFATGNVNALESMELCLKKYKETKNTEYLCDAANYLMFEFMFPQIKGHISKQRIPKTLQVSLVSAKKKWKN